MLALLALTACRTENIGPSGGDYSSISGVTPFPYTMFQGETVTFTATVAMSLGPYTAIWDFGGGATPNHIEGPGETGGSTSVTVTMGGEVGTFEGYFSARDNSNPELFAAVYDPLNPEIHGNRFKFLYTVDIQENNRPRIAGLSFSPASGTISVSVEDFNAEDSLTVHVTKTPAGIVVTPPSQAAANPGTVTFNVSASDVLVGGAGDVGFVVEDSVGNPASVSNESTVFVDVRFFPTPADILFATPLARSVSTGEPVTVLVITGVPANPFQYLVGCGLTIESDADYVSAANSGGNASFNVGAVGGAQGAADGIWAAMKGGAGPGGGFLLAPDNFIQATDIGGGRERWDFNITPLQGPGDTPTTNNLTSASGALFNCQFTFSTPGTKTFGFEEVRGVKRTYYADDSTEYFWGNIANDGSVVPNSVVVN